MQQQGILIILKILAFLCVRPSSYHLFLAIWCRDKRNHIKQFKILFQNFNTKRFIKHIKYFIFNISSQKFAQKEKHNNKQLEQLHFLSRSFQIFDYFSKYICIKYKAIQNHIFYHSSIVLSFAFSTENQITIDTKK